MNKKQTELLFNKFVLENHNASWGNDVLSAKRAEERYKSYGITPPHRDDFVKVEQQIQQIENARKNNGHE